MNAMAHSEGALSQANDMYLDSIQAHIQSLKNTFDTLLYEDSVTEFINEIIDSGQKILEFVGKLIDGIEKIGGIKTVLGTILPMLISAFSSKIISNVQLFITGLKGIGTSFSSLKSSLTSYTASQNAANAAMNTGATAANTLSAALGAIGLALSVANLISGVVQGIVDATSRTKELKEEIPSLSEIQSENSELTDLFQKYVALTNQVSLTADEKDELRSVTSDLLAQLGIEKDAVIEASGAYDDYKASITEALKASRDLMIADASMNLSQARSALTTAASLQDTNLAQNNMSWDPVSAIMYGNGNVITRPNDAIAGFRIVKEGNKDLEKQIQLLQDAGFYVGALGYDYSVYLGRVDINDPDSVIAYVENLEKAMAALSTSDVTSDLYKQISAEYAFFEKWIGQARDATAVIEDLAMTEALETTMLTTDMSDLAEFRRQYIINAAQITDANDNISMTSMDVVNAVDAILRTIPAFRSYYEQLEGAVNDAVGSKTSSLQSTLSALTESLGADSVVSVIMRPQVDMSDLQKAGWDVDNADPSSLFVRTFANDDDSVAINFTPVVLDEYGNVKNVLTPKELELYAKDVIDGVRQDDLKLMVGTKIEADAGTAQAVGERIASEIQQNLNDFNINYDGEKYRNLIGLLTGVDTATAQASAALTKLNESLKEPSYGAGLDARAENYLKMMDLYDKGELGDTTFRAYAEYFGIDLLAGLDENGEKVYKTYEQIGAEMEALGRYVGVYTDENGKLQTDTLQGMKNFLADLDDAEESFISFGDEGNKALGSIIEWDDEAKRLSFDPALLFNPDKMKAVADSFGVTSEYLTDLLNNYKKYSVDWIDFSDEQLEAALREADMVSDVNGKMVTHVDQIESFLESLGMDYDEISEIMQRVSDMSGTDIELGLEIDPNASAESLAEQIQAKISELGGDLSSNVDIVGELLAQIPDEDRRVEVIAELADGDESLESKLTEAAENASVAIPAPELSESQIMSDAADVNSSAADIMKAAADVNLQAAQLMAGIDADGTGSNVFDTKLKELGDKWNDLTNGNVDYNLRPILTAQDMIAAGWTEISDASQEAFTTYTQGFNTSDFGIDTEVPLSVELTPILDDGTVLSPEALEDYLLSLDLTHGKEILLDDDKANLGIITNVHEESEWDTSYWDSLNNKLDTIKDEYEDVRIASQSVGEAITASMGELKAEELAPTVSPEFKVDESQKKKVTEAVEEAVEEAAPSYELPEAWKKPERVTHERNKGILSESSKDVSEFFGFEGTPTLPVEVEVDHAQVETEISESVEEAKPPEVKVPATIDTSSESSLPALGDLSPVPAFKMNEIDTSKSQDSVKGLKDETEDASEALDKMSSSVRDVGSAPMNLQRQNASLKNLSEAASESGAENDNLAGKLSKVSKQDIKSSNKTNALKDTSAAARQSSSALTSLASTIGHISAVSILTDNKTAPLRSMMATLSQVTNATNSAISALNRWNNTAVQTKVLRTTTVSKNATGTRHASPGLSLLGDEYSPSGQPRPELVVSGGEAYLAGVNGPTVGVLKRGDVVYTYDETKKIFGGRIGGTLSIPAFKQGADIDGSGTRVRTSTVTVKNPKGANGTWINWDSTPTVYNDNSTTNNNYEYNADGGSGGSSSGSSSSTDESAKPEWFDWIEVLIDRTERAINRLKQIAESTYKHISNRISATRDEISLVTSEIDIQTRAAERYMQQANMVGLQEDLARLVREGTIDINQYDEATQELISQYLQWYTKSLDCSKAVEELHENLASLYEDIFENTAQNYESQLERLAQFTTDYVNIFDSIATSSGGVIPKLTEELKSLKSAFDEAMRSGAIEEGSEAWYSMLQTMQEVQESISGEYVELFNNTKEAYDNQLGLLQNYTDSIENALDKAEAKGYLISTDYYAALQRIERENIRVMNAELGELQKRMADAMNSGRVEKYSKEWFAMNEEINATKKAIDEANVSLLNYDKTMRELNWSNFEYIQDRISQITQEADFLIDLMSNDKLFEDNGQFNNLGVATLGLHAENYDVYMAQAKKYREEMLRTQADIAKNPYNTDIRLHYEELNKLQQDSILAAEKEKDAIKSLVEEGIKIELDNLKELIDTYKESLSNAKDLYSYQKNIAEQTENIAKLSKQLNAYSGDNSEENRARLQRITVDLNEAQEKLQETQYDRFVSDSQKLLDNFYDEYSELINARLDDVDQLLNEMIVVVNNNSDTIKTTLIDEAGEVGYKLTDNMNAIWSASSGIKDVVSSFNTDFTNNMTTIHHVLNNIDANTKGLLDKSKSEVPSTSGASSIGTTATTSGTNKATTISTPKASTSSSSSSSKISTSRSLSYGMRGDDVTQLQRRLADLGYYSGDIDGYFGDYTLNAVQSYQIASGLYLDGIAGTQTINSLNGNAISRQSAGKTTVSGNLSYGMSGSGVTALQKRLTELGYYTGYVDGYFGDQTWNAVLSFQKNNGLYADGIVGDQTTGALNGNPKKGIYTRYATGGLVTKTGLAMLDGTAQKPELVLNAQDTQNFIALKDFLSTLASPGFLSEMSNSPLFSRAGGGLSNTINGGINIQIGSVENYNDFLNQMRSDSKFERLIQSMTTDRLAGRSSLAKNGYNWK